MADFNGMPTWRAASAEFKVHFDFRHARQVKADGRQGKRAFVEIADVPHVDDVVASELVCGLRNPVKGYGDAKRPRVFSNSGGLGVGLPEEMYSMYTSVAEDLVLAQLHYYGVAVTPFDVADASRNAMGFVVSSSGTDTIQQGGIPGTSTLGMRLRLGLSMTGDTTRDRYGAGFGQYYGRQSRNQQGVPAGKRPFVAKRMDGMSFGQKMLEHVVAYAYNPDQYKMAANPKLHVPGGAPFLTMVGSLHTSYLTAGVLLVYELAQRGVITFSQGSGDLIDYIKLGTSGENEGKVNNLASGLGIIEAAPSGASPNQMKAWDVFRRNALMTIFYDRRNALQGYAAQANDDVAAISPSGRVLMGTPSGQVFQRQINHFRLASSAIFDALEHERGLYIGRVVSPGKNGATQRIIKDVF